MDAEADLRLFWTHRSFCWFCYEVAQVFDLTKFTMKTKGQLHRLVCDFSGLPYSGKNVWKMNFCPGQIVREFWFQSRKLRKNEKSQGKVRTFQNFPKIVIVLAV